MRPTYFATPQPVKLIDGSSPQHPRPDRLPAAVGLDSLTLETAHAHHDWYTAGQQTNSIMRIIRDQVLPAVLDN